MPELQPIFDSPKPGGSNTKKIILYFLGGLVVAVLLVLVIFPNAGISRLFTGNIGVDTAPPALDLSSALNGGDSVTSSGAVASTAAPADAPPGMDFSGLFTDTNTTTCTDNETNADSTEICQDNEFFLCDAELEGALTDDESMECANGTWQEVVAPSEEVTLSNVKASPSKFDPIAVTDAETKIQFKIDGPAFIDITITGEDDYELKLLEDEEVTEAGEYEEIWYGTEDNDITGIVVPVGEYDFTVTAKNEAGDTLDTASGKVEVDYDANVNSNTNAVPTTTTTTTTTTPTTTPAATVPTTTTPASTQAAATMAVQNRDTGRTSETGPGILIYAALPAFGFFLRKKKK